MTEKILLITRSRLIDDLIRLGLKSHLLQNGQRVWTECEQFDTRLGICSESSSTYAAGDCPKKCPERARTNLESLSSVSLEMMP